MAKAFVFSLCLLLVFNGCLAARQSQLSPQNQCQLNQLQAREPDNRIQAEAGQIETWNFNQEDFQCAGVAASRITIQRNGLHLPSYSNAPQLIYIVQGRGVLGAVFSGCPETFEESQQSSQQGRQQEQEQERQQQQQGEQGRQQGQQEQQQERQGRQQGRQQQEEGRQQEQQQGQQGRPQQQQQFRQFDRHQKTRRIREGDVVAIPAGVAYWSYNDGDQELVAVNLFHVSSDHNQLDQNPRKFYLAGNPENEFNQQGQSQPRQQGEQGRPGQHQQPFGRPRQQEQQGSGNNVFSGFNTQLLAQALNVNEETARNLQGQNDNRNQIIRVRGNLDFVQPPRGRQEREHEERQQEQLQQERQQQGGQLMANGLEETFCSLRLKENIGNPERADIFSPRAGRISTLNSHNLPILRFLRLSAERGFFYRNGIYSPHWNVNAHSVVYVIRGNARVQVVNENGDAILDQEVQQGQLFIVPQNHGVIQQAGNQGFEYFAFKTEENAFINTLAGRTSFLRALPDEVLANAYQISREQARQLKYNRQETIALSSSQQRRAVV
uniref:Prunin 1 Pru du 6.0101 n=1 Tax=Prunus dulcis TaxID=3755 RepID=PRU01_PRUDU|nr:RecName: Full=Prunin 1 Pru du 6.0101; Short=Pru1 Pru du 6.0101; AltName: Full=11S globulin; AltName: Full=11S seed storage protein; AltName: Full=Allergen Pru du 6.01; AltName: Full=Amandin Pru du 6.0101; AltName: Allergen=Pru du 6.0101; Contains: RecName: Full=Prunin 1 Pru du 6.0101 acidic chain; Contains: RecName: Full=Prunin 1 Pru du 6.0101 basic chain; Flags: Precursor [Prunus dulcis]ADN39440.1 prunin 1 precursor [Prunus dulcis]